MIKLTFCLVRRPEFTRPAFQAYWRDTHAPLVFSVRGPLRIRRYVQLHSFSEDTAADLRQSRGGPAEFDGVAQLWWDSWMDLQESFDDPAARDAGRLLLEDERRFIDLALSPLWWGEESVIF
ncbi:MAG TPA: EthD domain-containing protein [Caulobacteraceae bacterium]|jgi:uncharacterized protein (TIGR02118 family)|nr:EthD domain-containing protein [Caulobacteraceae bacterium]